jgi:hypothetical protein
MDSKNNVIDLAKRRKEKLETKTEVSRPKEKAPVLDMTERRNEIINQERRRVRRTILTEFVGAFVVVPNQGLLKVSLYDISETGVAFDIETAAGHFAKSEEIAFRVYMNQNTYFPFTVQVSPCLSTIFQGAQYTDPFNVEAASVSVVARHAHRAAA